MRTIWKFPLPITDEVSVNLPSGYSVLCVQMQHGQICLWVLCDPKSPEVKQRFFIFGTGNPISDKLNLKYVGTVQQLSGRLVWHIFAETNNGKK